MGNPTPTPEPKPVPTPTPTPTPTPSSKQSKPDEGGFQLNEDYVKQLTDISTDYATAIVSLTTGIAASPLILDSIAILQGEHDFSSETKTLDSISALSETMNEEAATMSLEFEGLIDSLNRLDEFILDGLRGLKNSHTKDEIMEEYSKYKEGRISFSEFLNFLETNENIDKATVYSLFGYDINSDDLKTLCVEFDKKCLEQILIDICLTNYSVKLGLNLALDAEAYGFSQGVAYAISSAMFDSLKKAAGKIDSSYIDLNGILANTFGSFFVNALIVSSVNTGLHLIEGDLDSETLFRSVGDGFAIAGSSALGNATSAVLLTEGGLINSILISAGINPATWAPLAAAGVVALTYWGGSKAVNYAADQIWTDEKMNFSHDRLVEDLTEEGKILVDSRTIPGSNENIVEAYLRMEKEGAPRSLTNYYLGAAGLPYDHAYDNSIDFNAISFMFDETVSVPAGELDNNYIEESARIIYPEDTASREKFVDTCIEIRDYYREHPGKNNNGVQAFI